MKPILLGLSILALMGTRAFAQIDQTHPDLCALPEGSVPTLPPMSATVDRTQGLGTLFIGEGSSAREVKLPNVVDSILEVCPLPSGNLLLFGETSVATNMVIIDAKKAVVVDAFYGFDPAISPEQRWLVYRKFYPRWHDDSISEEYLLYDLTKTAAQNRPPNMLLTDPQVVGKVIFPAGRTNGWGSSYNLPEDRAHDIGSINFSWSDDSQLVIFGDSLQGHFAVIAVAVESDGRSQAYEHAIPISQACKTNLDSKDFHLVISHTAITQLVQGEYSVVLDFSGAPGICEPPRISLRFPEDFQLSRPEIPFHPPVVKKKPAIVDR